MAAPGGQRTPNMAPPPPTEVGQSLLSNPADLPAPGARDAQQVDDPNILQIDGLLNDYAQGKLKAVDVQKQMPKGYSVNLKNVRGKGYDVYDPKGINHFIPF